MWEKNNFLNFVVPHEGLCTGKMPYARVSHQVIDEERSMYGTHCEMLKAGWDVILQTIPLILVEVNNV